MFDIGLVCGKFYPLHAGHEHLIRCMAAMSQYPIVFVAHSPNETISGDVRTNWIREIFPHVEVISIEALPGENDNSKAWADYTEEILGFKPDAVFTSEDYGRTWAEELGCRHVNVDQARSQFPVSGTAVRNNPKAYWKFLSPPVRSYFTQRICVIGGESTGKSTLVKNLANHYSTLYVPEYGRQYYEDFLPSKDDPSIFEAILRVQPQLEEDAARHNKQGLIFCDTDLLTTAIWYRGWRYDWVEEDLYWDIDEAGVRLARNYDLYLLCDYKDVPWVDDGTRSEGNKREWFHKQFEQELYTLDLPYAIIRGSNWEERTKKAIQAVDKVLRSEQNNELVRP